MERIWSEYQKAVFNFIENGTGHGAVKALAGSGKTEVIVEASNLLPKDKKSLFCAFNKSIQEELQSKLPQNVKCMTLHSLGLQEILTSKRFGKPTINNKKLYNIVDSIISKRDLEEQDINPYEIIINICKTVDWCKNTLTDTPNKIEDIIIDRDIDTCDMDMDKFISYVCQTLRLSKEKTNEIDFGDMIWFPFVYNLHKLKFDYVFVDEVQDLSKAQIELSIGAISSKGRYVAVGDRFQALYSWRGADSFIFDNLKDRLSPTEFDLPICYRCPKKVIELAQKFVPTIQHHENAIDGEIINISSEELFTMAKPGDVVISRTNAPLVKNCMRCLKQGIPANILGRDLSEGLLSIIKKSKKRDVNSFLVWLNTWREKEIAKLQAKDPQADVEGVQDKFECLQNFCDEAKSIKDVVANIQKLFAENDKSKIVTHSSTHRAKGLGFDNVFLLETFRSSSQEERNIKYVAVTRAKKKLFFVKKSFSEDNRYIIEF